MVILATLFVSLFAHTEALYEELTVTRNKDNSNNEVLCFKPFPALKKTKPRCLRVDATAAQTLEKKDSGVKITEVALEVLGREEKTFGVVLRWEGKSSGILEISLKGRLNVIGHFENVNEEPRLVIDQFSDQKMDQQLDRRMLFGETDTFKLHARTKIWLEETLAPALIKIFDIDTKLH